jgi:hypothetical protein
MDIDIDFADRTQILDIIQHVPASLDGVKKHNTGIYCHAIPVNPLTGQASIDYKTAEARGYFKIDFLNVGIYNGVKNEADLERLLDTEPLWELLGEKAICDQLFHVNGYHELLAQLKPACILDLAKVLAMIRPAKKHLIPVCKQHGFAAIDDEIWTKTEDTYYFKKSHSVGYATAIIVQLNSICESFSV